MLDFSHFKVQNFFEATIGARIDRPGWPNRLSATIIWQILLSLLLKLSRMHQHHEHGHKVQLSDNQNQSKPHQEQSPLHVVL